jgi:hypothetical protein
VQRTLWFSYFKTDSEWYEHFEKYEKVFLHVGPEPYPCL